MWQSERFSKQRPCEAHQRRQTQKRAPFNTPSGPFPLIQWIRQAGHNAPHCWLLDSSACLGRVLPRALHNHARRVSKAASAAPPPQYQTYHSAAKILLLQSAAPPLYSNTRDCTTLYSQDTAHHPTYWQTTWITNTVNTKECVTHTAHQFAHLHTNSKN